MNLKITKSLLWLAILALIFSFVSPLSSADAAGEIYVNDSQGVLGVDINSAYAVGSGGTAVVGDTYVLTNSGTVKLGQSGIPTLNGNEDGTTVKVTATTAKIGLYYYYSGSRDTSLATANLENSAGKGYQFGYYDSNRVFNPIGSTAETKITMRPTGSGREVSVYITGTETLLYRHTNTTYNLAVRPVNTNGKAVTWFKNNTYYGDFEYYRYISDKMTVINILDIEDYVKGVVPIEMSPTWPLEALKAQAVCARSYYATCVNQYSKYGFDVTADTYSQVYYGTGRATAHSDSAVDATRGKYVTYNGKVCTTFYYSSNGGGSENCENIFEEALPYCRGIIDPFEDAVPQSVNGRKTWSKSFSFEQINSRASTLGVNNVVDIQPVYSETGNVIKLTFIGSGGSKATISKASCYSFLGLSSIRYTVTKTATGFVFDGSGYGHSVGMSQFGAYSMALNYGMNYLQILRFYYAGVSISTGI